MRKEGRANVTKVTGTFREYVEGTINGFWGNMELQCAMCLQCRVLVNNALHESRTFLIPFCQQHRTSGRAGSLDYASWKGLCSMEPSTHSTQSFI